ncbi:MAG: hypothetical protein CMF64_09055 [Magnetovibrio sp.]|nr:hypothetical protein [Magnetovibrio sp.]|tara:strand:- start:983 stop:1192 length:210 start_codon:yes stop_codon:yes gene_type:complete
MIFYDFIVNSMGGISSPEPVAFIWKPEIMQMYFAHSYQHYFEEAGFKLVETEPCVHESGKHGYGLIRAV